MVLRSCLPCPVFIYFFGKSTVSIPHKIINKKRKIHIIYFRTLNSKSWSLLQWITQRKRTSSKCTEHDGKSTQWNKWEFDFNVFTPLTHPGSSYYQCRCFGERLDPGGSWLYGGLVLTVCFAVTGVARRWMGLADAAAERAPPRAPDSKPVLHQATL